MAPKAMDIFTKEGNNGASIAALRQEFKQNLLVSFFKTPEELASLVSQAIHNWEIHHEASKEGLLLKDDVHTKAERETRLKAIMADHTGFLRGRLESFVGREVELAAIRQRIAEKLTSGGYVTITGQAGQGKSSIIAKLVSEYEETKAAFHFIPFNPGPDHQVGLLRNLIARLVLRYDLPEFYVPSESRPALRDYFPKVLHEVVAKGGQEVIFIDGLDQLEEEQSGVRDLSFLPNNPPQGIVFVLGTRPNDTLKPLELLKPRHEYKLPNLSRKDFDLILQRRQVQLDKELTDQLYRIMQENALYLDLIAKELAQEKAVRPEDIITRVVNDPEAIFSLSIDRLQKKPNDVEWHEVLKPILAVLLVTREPLTSRHIRQIIQTRHIQNVDDQQIRNGLMRLGGLLTDDGRKRYALFHLKLYDYLRQDKTKPEKSYVFATDEEESWHNTLVLGCESGDISRIWDNTEYDIVEQVRRGYARRHYITHLYNAQEWQKLFNILDDGAYGQAKVRFDPSMRAYAQDLDLGRQVAASTHWGLQEGLNKLAHLWRYTLLRCSLASRADKYSIKAFRLLLLLKRETEALNLAELLTNAIYKVDVLCEIAKLIGQQPGRESEYIQLLLRACEIAYKIENDLPPIW